MDVNQTGNTRQGRHDLLKFWQHKICLWYIPLILREYISFYLTCVFLTISKWEACGSNQNDFIWHVCSYTFKLFLWCSNKTLRAELYKLILQQGRLVGAIRMIFIALSPSQATLHRTLDGIFLVHFYLVSIFSMCYLTSPLNDAGCWTTRHVFWRYILIIVVESLKIPYLIHLSLLILASKIKCQSSSFLIVSFRSEKCFCFQLNFHYCFVSPIEFISSYAHAFCWGWIHTWRWENPFILALKRRGGWLIVSPN
jgi:hypothetical protein